jgi:putative redox protein
MSSKTTVSWKGGMAFDAALQGYTVPMDSIPEFGGQNHGPTPKPLLLVALGGCTGMDVVSLLEKMHLGPFTLDVDVEGESMSTPRYSIRFTSSIV